MQTDNGIANIAHVVRDLSVRALTKIIPSSHATIFMLHRMADPDIGSTGHTAEELRAALTQLRRSGANFVSVEQMMREVREGPVSRGPLVSFTMDDGFVDQAKIAGPIFAEFDCPATFFLISGLLDKQLWPWDSQVDYLFRNCKKHEASVLVRGKLVRLYFHTDDHMNASRRAFREFCKTLPNSELDDLLQQLSLSTGVELPDLPPPENAPMEWSAARGLRDKGIRFAPHTVSHRIVSRMTDEQAEYEIEHSYRRVSDELGECDKVFAWPNGRNVDFGKRENRILERLGFLGSVHTEPVLVPTNAGAISSRVLEWGRVGFPDSKSDIARSVSPLGKARHRLMRSADFRFGGRRGLRDLIQGLIANSFGRRSRFDDIQWAHVERLVFLCAGNICRSPYAEAYAIANGLAAVSCGTDALANVTANHNAIQVAEARGIELFDHRSRNVEEIEFQATDLVLGFDMKQVDVLATIREEYDSQVGLVGHWGKSIGSVLPDPFGCSTDYFHRCFEEIERSINNIASETLAADRKHVGRGADA